MQIAVAIGVMPSALTAPVPAEASEFHLSREFQVKAVFLYNFAQFVEWPPSAFDSPTSPLVIGVLGQDPFGNYLDEAVRGEKVNGHPLVVQRFRRVSDIRTCHILFVSGSEGPRAEQVAENLHGRSILTVCDWEGFARRGGIIRFVMEHSHVRLRINLDAAKDAGLTISSKLLRSAELVTGAQ
ncbi:MAG TPA: YfiR family protein [Opitutus sp.]|nr:YfiR family protein [Opitutus sp.]